MNTLCLEHIYKEDCNSEILKVACVDMHKTAEPSEGQKNAGNYKMKHIRYNGMEISIENPAGSVRRGVGHGGKAWSNKMYNHYGYIRKTMGKDGDHVDVFIKPGTKETEKVFIINQVNPGKRNFDEHKCMLGFKSEEEARKAYLSSYDKGWTGIGSVATMTVNQFKKWVYSGDRTKPAKSVEEKEMSKIAEDIYEAAFIDELEKIAFPIRSIGSAIKRGWTPLVKSQKDVARSNRLRSGLKNVVDEKYSLLRQRNRAQRSVKRLESKGGIERLFGNTFGSRAKRLRNLRSARGNRRSVMKDTEKRLGSLDRRIGRFEHGVGLDEVADQGRNAVNTVSRVGIVGTGAIGATAAAKPFLGGGNNQRQHYR